LSQKRRASRKLGCAVTDGSLFTAGSFCEAAVHREEEMQNEASRISENCLFTRAAPGLIYGHAQMMNVVFPS